MIPLAIFGAGRMGTLVAELAPGAGFEVVVQRGGAEAKEAITPASLRNAAVAIEFTVPTAAAIVVRGCASAGIPVVSGTTGWDAERGAVEGEVRKGAGALLWSPNFAVGVHHFTAVVEEAARRFLGAGFTPEIVETHHTKKLDAPSGTARLLADRVAAAGGKEPPIWSVREGEVVGRHELTFDAAFEQVRLVHDALDRRVFAAGALTAARWIVGKRGVFTLKDLLDGVDAR